jgi:hypothetical protein
MFASEEAPPRVYGRQSCSMPDEPPRAGTPAFTRVAQSCYSMKHRIPLSANGMAVRLVYLQKSMAASGLLE